MKKNIKNDKTIKALSFALAAMISTTSLPMTALAADEGTVVPDGEPEESTEAKSENVVAAERIEEIAEETQEAVQEAVDTVVESDTETNEETDTLVEAAEAVEAISTEENADSTSSEAERQAVEGVADDAETVTENVKKAAENIDLAVDDIKTAADDIEDAQQANTDYAEAVDKAESAADTSDRTATEINTEIAEANKAVEDAIENIEGATSIDEAKKIAEEANSKVEEAKSDYEEKKADYKKAKDEYEKALEDMEKADADYDAAVKDLEEAKKDAAKELVEASKELKEAKDAAADITAKVAEAEKIVDKLKSLAEQANEQWTVYENQSADAVDYLAEANDTEYKELSKLPNQITSLDNTISAHEKKLAEAKANLEAATTAGAKTKYQKQVDQYNELLAKEKSERSQKAERLEELQAKDQAALKAEYDALMKKHADAYNEVFDSLYDYSLAMINYEMVASGNLSADASVTQTAITGGVTVYLPDEEGNYVAFKCPNKNYNKIQMVTIQRKDENGNDITEYKYYMFEAYRNEEGTTSSDRAPAMWKEGTKRVVAVEFTAEELKSMWINGNPEKAYDGHRNDSTTVVLNTQLRADKINNDFEKYGDEYAEKYGTDISGDRDYVLSDTLYGDDGTEGGRWDSIYSVYNREGISDELKANIDAYNKLKEEAAAAEEKIAAAQSKVENLQNQIDALEAAQKASKEVDLSARISALKDKLDTAEEAMKEAEENVKDLDEKSAEMQKTLDEKIKDLTPATKKKEKPTDNTGSAEDSTSTDQTVSEESSTESTSTESASESNDAIVNNEVAATAPEAAVVTTGADTTEQEATVLGANRETVNIDDEDVAKAGAATVLGEKASTESEVLGARRDANTGDATSTTSAGTMMAVMFGSSAIAGMWFGLRRKFRKDK